MADFERIAEQLRNYDYEIATEWHLPGIKNPNVKDMTKEEKARIAQELKQISVYFDLASQFLKEC